MVTTFYLLWFRRRSYFWEFQIPIIYDCQHCQGLQLVYRVWKKWFHVKSGLLELMHDDNILPDFIIVQFFDCASGFINCVETYKHVSSIGSRKVHHKSHFINSSTLKRKSQFDEIFRQTNIFHSLPFRKVAPNRIQTCHVEFCRRKLLCLCKGVCQYNSEVVLHKCVAHFSGQFDNL